jgi:hypothetical protein
MKKWFVFSALLAILLLGATALAEAFAVPESGDLSKDAAIELAKQAFTAETGKSEKELLDGEIVATFVSLGAAGEDQKVWMISFFEQEAPPPSGLVTVTSPSGEILRICTDNHMVIRAEWEEIKGKYDFWSLEDKLLFDTLCNPPDATTRCALPKPGQLMQEDAREIAVLALIQKYGVSRDTLNALTTAYAFWSGPTGIPNKNDDKWVVGFISDRGCEYQVNVSATDGTVYLINSFGAGWG